MKYLVLVSNFWVILALVACGTDGGDSSSAKTSSLMKATTQPASAAAETTGSPVKPEIRVPPGPPPRKLVVRSLKKGSGPGARRGQRLSVQYVGVSYRTGKPFEVRWGKNAAFSFYLGIGEVRKGWDIGLKGMKVGGRRELILPSRLAYGTGALLYVVELLAIK